MTQLRAPRVFAVAALGLLAACSGGAEDESRTSGTAPLCTDDADSATPIRRLNRFEYGRSIHDLTGVDPGIAESLPPDERSLGFDNNAQAYSVSALHATKYLETAEEIAQQFVADT
jgi:hypothetical protein